MTNKNRPSSKFSQLAQNGRTVPAAVFVRNRAKIRQQQAQRVEPVVMASTSAAPWWGPFGAKVKE